MNGVGQQTVAVGPHPVPLPAGGDIRMRAGSVALLVVGGVLTARGAFSDLDLLAFAWLWGFSFIWTVVVGALFFVALQHLTASVWSAVVRRVAEAIAGHAWLVAVLALPVLAFAWLPDAFHVFPWADAAHVEGDPVLSGKTPYLNPVFFTARGVLFVLIFAAYGRYFVSLSLAQDTGREGAGASVRMRRAAPVFMLLFAVSVTFGAIDWLMSLDPHYFSTIFGIYVFAGMFVTGVAVITLGVLDLRHTGRLGHGIVRDDHVWSLGALLFGMSCFWAYIAFSQFMLIWYGNLPEETAYFQVRLGEAYLPVTIALAVLRFAVPFLLLLGRAAKRSATILSIAAVAIVAGQALDLYWIVMPAARPAEALPGLFELGPILAMTGALGLCVWRFLNRNAAIPVRDPVLGRSLAHHL